MRKGDTVAVVGESGSGKSTLARVVTGLLSRVAGDVRFNGTSLPPRLKDRTKDQLRRVQMIYQMPDVALNPQHTLLETIGRPVRFISTGHGWKCARACVELLAQMDLPEPSSPARPANCRAGRSSACRSPGRSPPSPT